MTAYQKMHKQVKVIIRVSEGLNISIHEVTELMEQYTKQERDKAFEAGYRYYREVVAESKRPYDEAAKITMKKGLKELKTLKNG